MLDGKACRILQKTCFLLFHGIALSYLAWYKPSNVQELSKSEFLEILISCTCTVI